MPRLSNLFPWRRRRMEHDLARELGDHVERRVADLRRSGLSESESRRQAAIELGGVAQVQEEVRDTWTWQWLDNIRRDISFALRTLQRTPGFTSAAVLSLALAIGATTAIFSVVYGILLKPLPYPNPNQLVTVWQDMREKGGPIDEWATPGNLADWRAQSRVFSSIASIRNWAPTLVDSGSASRVVGEQVTEDYFKVLGVTPEVGRVFRPDEAVPNAPRVAVISHRFWMERFGGAKDVLQKQITLSDEPHQIVGVMPESFRPIVNQNTDVWRPDRLNLTNPNRGAIVLRVVARLQPTMTLGGAQSIMNSVAKDLAQRYPDTSGNVGIQVVSLHERVVGNVRSGMVMLLGAVTLVLLIACVNIANLLLARGSSRIREMAVRAALGAARARVLRQLLTESLVLAAAGGITGVLLSIGGVKALVALAPAALPRLDEIAMDSTVLLVSAAATILTGLIFGVVPAVQLARSNHALALNEGSRGMSSGSAHRLRRGLVIAEMAIALMLLVGGGLLLRSFVALQRADLGFNPDRVVSALLTVPPNRFKAPAEAIAFEDQVMDRLRAVPGMTRVGWSSILPLAPGGDSDMDFTIEGVPPPPPNQPGIVTWYRIVSEDYPALMGMRVRSGRLFTGREAEPGVIINKTLATRYWKDTDPVGKRVRFGDGGDGLPWFTIIGVVDDVSQQGAQGGARGQMFIPYWHSGALAAGTMNLVVKTDVSADAIGPSLAQAIRELDPRLPVSSVLAMNGLVGQSVAAPRFLAAIAGAFALLAMLLAAVGVYGVMAYAVTSREQEISVRLALGATRSDIFTLTYRNGLRLMVIGIGLGIAGAAALAPALKTLLYGLQPLDVATFAMMTAVVAVTSGLAVLIPAARATRVDAAKMLR